MKRVWAYAKLPELKNQVGWVDIEKSLAERLLQEGKVQDVTTVHGGPYGLKYVGTPLPTPPAPPEGASVLSMGEAPKVLSARSAKAAKAAK